MSVQVLLLRGINVGGHGKLPMAELRDILLGLGAHDVQTYIQSGNAVFQGDLGANAIVQAIDAAKGFTPKAMLFNADEFSLIARGNPFDGLDGKTVHIWFTADAPAFDFTTAETLSKDSERIEVQDNAIYLHAPDGIGRSKLAAKIEKLAGVPCTARNLNSVNKLMEIIASYE